MTATAADTYIRYNNMPVDVYVFIHIIRVFTRIIIYVGILYIILLYRVYYSLTRVKRRRFGS